MNSNILTHEKINELVISEGLELILTDTRERCSRAFARTPGSEVTMYSCWPTVYSKPHIGNFRAYLFPDILKRTLQLLGYDVKHVINITDVGHMTSDEDAGEDKMEKAARHSNKSAEQIAQHYEEIFKDGLASLNIIEPHSYPKASWFIQEQISYIQDIEARGMSYVTSSGVYLDTASDDKYFDFAWVKSDQQIEGNRSIVDGEKHNPADFALWRFSKPSEHRQQEWESPWGKGFPGWHIECSAMIEAILWANIDIHTWGEDHIKVHHAAEVSQHRCSGKTGQLADFWLHWAFLNLGGKKIAKSSGEKFYLDDIDVSPVELRYFYLLANYRKPQAYSDDIVQAAAQGYRNLKKICLDLKATARNNSQAAVLSDLGINYTNDLLKHLLNNINTSGVLGVLQKMLKNDTLSVYERVNIVDFFDQHVLDLDLLQEKEESQSPEVPTAVEELKKQRAVAKKSQNWEKADQLREEIRQLGWLIQDTQQGQHLEYIN